MRSGINAKRFVVVDDVYERFREAIAHLARVVELLPESESAKKNLRSVLRLRARRSEQQSPLPE